jgi:hypothetical protein
MPAPQPRPAAGAAPADFPAAYYQRLPAQGSPVFRVDPGRSLVVIEARRGGSLARLGHDHVVASRDVTGYVAPEGGRADLYVRLDTLVVDAPDLRAAAGFDTRPSAADIDGTRRNMLEQVLEAAAHPFAQVAVTGAVAGNGLRPVRVVVTLHGATREVDASARTELTADEVLVEGTMAIDQTWFGITPFSILGGAIAVQDRLDIAFRIHAHRVQPEARASPASAPSR